MRRVLLTILLSVVSVTLSAQYDADYLKSLVANNRVSFKYSLGVKGAAPVKMDGKVVLDGDCYSVRGNNLEMYCDGTTKWVVDREALEVYIESSEGTKDFLADPSAWIDNVKNLKISENSVSGSYWNAEQEVTINFKFTAITPSPLSGSTEGFVFDVGSLGAEWLVTDLR